MKRTLGVVFSVQSYQIEPPFKEGPEVFSTGDVTGDGLTDLFVYTAEQDEYGEFVVTPYASVFSAEAGPLPFDADLPQDGFAVNPAVLTEVRGSCDFDQDGAADFFSYSRGDLRRTGDESFALHFGPLGGLDPLLCGLELSEAALPPPEALDGKTGYRIVAVMGPAPLEQTQSRVEQVGDVDGDGAGDLLLNPIESFLSEMAGIVTRGAPFLIYGGEKLDFADRADGRRDGSIDWRLLAAIPLGDAGERLMLERSGQVVGGRGRDVVRGSSRADAIELWEGDDRGFGLHGSDRLVGGAGADVLNGGGGHDTIEGGEDRDVLRGGPGRDVFRFVSGFGEDRILDFRIKVDVLDFSEHRLVDRIDELVIRQVADHAVMYDGHGGRLVVAGVDVARLDAGEFLFA